MNIYNLVQFGMLYFIGIVVCYIILETNRNAINRRDIYSYLFLSGFSWFTIVFMLLFFGYIKFTKTR